MSDYPLQTTRIYRMGWGQRIFGFVFSGLSIFFLVAFWGGALSGAREATFLELFIPIVFLMVGVFLTVRAFKNFIALSEMEISLHSLSGQQTLLLTKIRGRRRYLDHGTDESPSIWYLKIESNDDRYAAIEFAESYYKLDEIFRTWFKSLPDLDELDKTRPKPSNFGLV